MKDGRAGSRFPLPFLEPPKHVKGLTADASIWVTTAVGMLAGLARYVLAAATVLVFCVLHVAALLRFKGGNEEKGPE